MIITGGYRERRYHAYDSDVDVLPRDPKSTFFSMLPNEVYGTSMSFHNDTILLCGGTSIEKQCLYLDGGIWEEHSILNKKRIYHSSVTTQTATFIFGGEHSKKTFEYLPKDSNTWIKGKTEIPGDGFAFGSAIAVKSEQEIWLIGGKPFERSFTADSIISFNVNNHSFQTLPCQLSLNRSRHRCAYIPNTSKIMITFGKNAEILDTTDGSVIRDSHLNSARYDHGMGVLTINGEDKLVVFGGNEGKDNHLGDNKAIDSVEVYNTETKNWETTDIKLKEPKHSFGFLTLKLSDIFSNVS